MRVIVFCVYLLLAKSIAERTVALILARGGSRGIRLKNLQIVGTRSLLQQAIINAKTVGLDVVVSTDHPAIALHALRNGCQVFHRSSVTASDCAPSLWGAAEFISKNQDVSVLVLLQATSPFIRVETISRALKLLSKSYDCVFSVKRSFKLRWRKDNEHLSPINFKVESRPRRQDWEGEFLETGGFYISRRHLIENGYFQNNNCTIVEVSHYESFEVDTYYDLKLANLLYFLRMASSSEEVLYKDLENIDVITVELVPERKGLILKHCEYYVSSRRHGTTVTRRYNEFLQLFDVLFAKYPYRAVCRLPPKRVVVGGGSVRFLQRRRAALQRWLTLVARHPLLAHDADMRAFLCELAFRPERPRHDEFTLGGAKPNSSEKTTEELQAAFVSEQEQLRLVHLGLGRLSQIFDKVENRWSAERNDVREMGVALSALASTVVNDTTATHWSRVRDSLTAAANVAGDVGEEDELEALEESAGGRLQLALDALSGYRELCARLTRGLHAERAAAAAAATHSSAAQALRDRHWFALRCALEEARVARAYALSALQNVPEMFRGHAAAHARVAALWADLHTALQHPYSTPLRR